MELKGKQIELLSRIVYKTQLQKEIPDDYYVENDQKIKKSQIRFGLELAVTLFGRCNLAWAEIGELYKEIADKDINESPAAEILEFLKSVFGGEDFQAFFKFSGK